MNARLENIKGIFEENGDFCAILANYLNKYERLITEEIMEELTDGDDRYDAIAFSTFLSSAFLNEGEYQVHMEREYFNRAVTKLDPWEYKNDPYYKNIKIPHIRLGDWTLGEQTYAPYEGFIWKDITVDGYREIPNLGFFDTEFSFPAVFENGVEWMAIKPNEIETMKEPIEAAGGDTLVFGLGMGYFAYMISQKPEVKTVTIIERNEHMSSLFCDYILPQMENREKIRIIHADAFDFMRMEHSERYDFAFVDLWHDVSDGVDLYIKMKKLEHLMPGTRFEYWIEKSILLSVRRRVFEAIYESEAKGKNTLSLAEIEKRLTLDYLKEFVKFI